MARNLQSKQPLIPNADQVSVSAIRLLKFERDIRQLESTDALKLHLVNQVRELVPYEQAFLFQRKQSAQKLQLTLISDIAILERDAPFNQTLEQAVQALDASKYLVDTYRSFPLNTDKNLTDTKKNNSPDLINDYPHQAVCWVPLFNQTGLADAGILLARDQAFSDQETTLLARIIETYEHAWFALAGNKTATIGGRNTRLISISLIILIVAAGLFPVRLSVMAPMQVIPQDPYVLTAPIDGVIKSIAVAPNTNINANTPLVTFEDLKLRNESTLAEQELAVAQARLSRVNSSIFSDADVAYELPIARAELNLAEVRYRYTQELLSQTQVTSPVAGLVTYTDRKDWEGRAVQVGEQILQVANPLRVQFGIDLPTGDLIELETGADISIYLDSAPLGGYEASLKSISHTPAATESNITSYRIIAEPSSLSGDQNGLDVVTDIPRIGARGTARLYGKQVTLAYQLLRRPIAVVRQYLGV